jgi:hypothetical protein
MTSEKKIKANRQNALKSTGPKTPEGKDAVRLNALKHGLLSQQVLLPGEDAEALRELGESLRAELQPEGAMEEFLVYRVTAACWRLLRASRVEVGIFARERSEELAEREEREARRYESSPLEEMAAASKGTTITDKDKHEEALSRAQQMRSEQESEIVTLGRAFVRDASKNNAFFKLSRHETSLERQFYKALHELDRRQAARRSGNVPAPLAVDVDVSGITEGDR